MLFSDGLRKNSISFFSGVDLNYELTYYADSKSFSFALLKRQLLYSVLDQIFRANIEAIIIMNNNKRKGGASTCIELA